MAYGDLGRQVVAPVGLAVVGTTALAWYVTLSTTDATMALAFAPFSLLGPVDLALFFALMVIMMVAMMLPATFPMIVGYRQMLKSKEEFARVGLNMGTTAFIAPYLLVWGGFGILALAGVSGLGLMGPMTSPIGAVPGFVLLAGGAYQVSSVKQACLRQCQSPFAFMLGSWRRGLTGAFRMGLSHAKFCLGCCWLFMLALFVVGGMSLIWMGVVSVMIFVEKIGLGKRSVSQAIGVVLVSLGLIVIAQTYFLL